MLPGAMEAVDILIEPIGAGSHNRIEQWSISECNCKWRKCSLCVSLRQWQCPPKYHCLCGCQLLCHCLHSANPRRLALAITAHSLTAQSQIALAAHSAHIAVYHCIYISSAIPLAHFHLYVCLTELFVSRLCCQVGVRPPCRLSSHSSYSSMFGAHRSSTALRCSCS